MELLLFFTAHFLICSRLFRRAYIHSFVILIFYTMGLGYLSMLFSPNFGVALIAYSLTIFMGTRFLDKKEKNKADLIELSSVILFINFYALLFFISLLWSDFISIGERLRDYSLLVEIHKNFAHPTEPWMSGTELSYYIFGYRFFVALSKITLLPPEKLYHQAVAVPLAFLMTNVFYFMKKHIRVNYIMALALSLLIGLGSNLQGLLDGLKSQFHWWNASRVIEGTINEFPAWSFLIGDLHPHYMSIGSMLFILLLHMNLVKRGVISLEGHIGLLAIETLILLNFNAWEVPILLGGAMVASGMLLLSRRRVSFSKNEFLKTWAPLLALSIPLLVSWGIKVSSGGHRIAITDQSLRTSVFEFSSHWFVPVAMIVIGLFRSTHSSYLKVIIIAGVVVSVLLNSLLIFLVTFLGISIFLFYRKINFGKAGNVPVYLGVCIFGLFIVLELFYLDDAYGGKFERMNTVFKVYTVLWPFVFLYGGSLLFSHLKKEKIFSIVLGSLVALHMIFFVRSIDQRRIHGNSIGQYFKGNKLGVDSLEPKFRGINQVVKQLVNEKEKVVLEAVTRPYWYGAHVAILSQNKSYLGWENHLNLLTRNYSEVSRRKKVVDGIYLAEHCSRVKEIAKKEGVHFIVWGPIERLTYKQRIPNNLSCLPTLVDTKGYKIFSI